MCKLFGVGVGPGDPLLVTLKAIRVIEKAEVVAIPAGSKEKCMAYNIVKDVVEGIDNKEILECPIPMTDDEATLNQAYFQGTNLIAKCISEGKNVAFLNLGDPVLYGTYMQFHNRILNMGYEAEIVGGVSSVSAVAGRLSIPLGVRRDSIHIIPGYYFSKNVQQSFEVTVEEYIRNKDTVVVMKLGKAVEQIVKLCVRLEKSKIAKASAVANCGMPNEIVFNDITDLTDANGYFTTIVIKPL